MRQDLGVVNPVNRAQPRRFRFALNASQGTDPGSWRRLARRTEAQGFDSLLIPDHFTQQLAPFTALASAAAATRSLRLGMLVACNDFRHPVAHAKEIATLDLLSNGRAVWGMGAGWLEPEYRQAGIAFDPPGVRVDRLVESIDVMRAMFRGTPTQFDGTHYQIDGAAGWPTPRQTPHPPLLIGAQARRLLSLAARTADIVGIGPSLMARSLFGEPPTHTPEEALDEQVRWIDTASPDLGRPAERNMVAFPIVITPDRGSAARRMAAPTGMEPDMLLQSPHAWIGTVEQICEQLVERRQRWGISFWVVPGDDPDATAPIVARLANT